MDLPLVYLNITFNIFVVGITPTALNISQNQNTSMLVIHWNSEGHGDYCIQSYAYPRANGIWNRVTNASYTLPLINSTYEIIIFLHPEMNMGSNFTIGKVA